jgi:hypothetical protein
MPTSPASAPRPGCLACILPYQIAAGRKPAAPHYREDGALPTATGWAHASAASALTSWRGESGLGPAPRSRPWEPALFARVLDRVELTRGMIPWRVTVSADVVNAVVTAHAAVNKTEMQGTQRLSLGERDLNERCFQTPRAVPGMLSQPGDRPGTAQALGSFPRPLKRKRRCASGRRQRAAKHALPDPERQYTWPARQRRGRRQGRTRKRSPAESSCTTGRSFENTPLNPRGRHGGASANVVVAVPCARAVENTPGMALASQLLSDGRCLRHRRVFPAPPEPEQRRALGPPPAFHRGTHLRRYRAEGSADGRGPEFV